MVTTCQKKLLDYRVGELLGLPRRVKAKHLRGFHCEIQHEVGRFLYGRDCKGSRMRATMKFAVICVSLLIAAHADASGQRNQMNALDFQERGARLRLELERAYQDLRHTGRFESAGNDVSSIVEKYVPVGTSFSNAETTLRSSGFNIDPLPPREPPKNPSPLWSDEH